MDWNLLVEFILRLSFGLAAAMAWTPPTQVSSGFFRVHLWVVMGLNTLAALAAGGRGSEPMDRYVMWLALAAVVISYVASVLWLYDQAMWGRGLLVIIAVLSLANAVMLTPIDAASQEAHLPWVLADSMTSGLLLGLTLSAMLLGHWYLNTPSMRLEPLTRLVWGVMTLVLLRAIVDGWGLTDLLQTQPLEHSGLWWSLHALRWFAGLLGTGLMAFLAWRTLKVPNTQSATGILYVAVIFVFLGELSAQMI